MFEAVWLCRAFSAISGMWFLLHQCQQEAQMCLWGKVWETESCKCCLCVLPCFSVCLHLPVGVGEQQIFCVQRTNSVILVQELDWASPQTLLWALLCSFTSWHKQFQSLSRHAASGQKFFHSFTVLDMLLLAKDWNSCFICCLWRLCHEWGNWNTLRVSGMQWNVRLIYTIFPILTALILSNKISRSAETDEHQVRQFSVCYFKAGKWICQALCDSLNCWKFCWGCTFPSLSPRCWFVLCNMD